MQHSNLLNLTGRKVRRYRMCAVAVCKRPAGPDDLCDSHREQLAELAARPKTRWTPDDLRYPDRHA
ncbi:hypothetical protein [Agromyces sp. NPDC055658]